MVEDFADEILRRRVALGWTQEELARAVGGTQAAVSRYEAANGNPTADTMDKFRRALLDAEAERISSAYDSLFRTAERIIFTTSPIATITGADVLFNVTVADPSNVGGVHGVFFDPAAITFSGLFSNGVGASPHMSMNVAPAVEITRGNKSSDETKADDVNALYDMAA